MWSLEVCGDIGGSGTHARQLREESWDQVGEELCVADLSAPEQGRFLLGAHHDDRGRQGSGACRFVYLCVCTYSQAYYGASQGLLDPRPGTSTAPQQPLKTDSRAAGPGQVCWRGACAGQRWDEMIHLSSI